MELMASATVLRCDGCGQAATTDHISRRLQRLEWATRYRPIHVHTLLLSGFSPRLDQDYLYSPDPEFSGEATLVLQAAGVLTAEKAKETVLEDVQRQGLFLAHVLECPCEKESASSQDAQPLIEEHLFATLARIRKSLKPKRLLLISATLHAAVAKVTVEVCGCPVVLDEGKPFGLDGSNSGNALTRLRRVLRMPSPG